MVRHKHAASLVCTVVVALLLAGCTSTASTPGRTSPPRPMSAAARRYLNAALDVMQQHALTRYRLDWAFLRRRALQEAAGAATPADTYGVIGLTLGDLEVNHHSHFFAPGQAVPSSAGAGTPAGRMLTASLGYLALPRDVIFSDNRPYIAAAEAVLRREEAHHPCGWVLDLRGHGGGALYPMLIGVQPLLGTGTVGFFVPPRGHRLPARLSTAAAYRDDKPLARAVTPDEHDLSRAPVAVLTGPDTGSSGEFVTIAFRGRPNARSFGQPTEGLPTGNDPFRLSDGATIVLTTVQEADRTGHVYPDAPVPPDQLVTGGSTTPTADRTDPAIRAAERWLRATDACTHSGRRGGRVGL